MKKNHAFISYVRENSRKVHKLAQALTDAGITVWLDSKDIKPAADWRATLRSAITEGAFFIACFSKAYYKRQTTHMNEELAIAIDQLRCRAINSPWFIPVQLDKCSIPDLAITSARNLRDIQCVKLFANWEDGVRDIAQVIQPSVQGEASKAWSRVRRNLQRKISRNRVLMFGDTPKDIFWKVRVGRNHQHHVYKSQQTQFDVYDNIERPGGIFACAAVLKELGYDVTCVTSIGDDSIGQWVRQQFSDRGISLIPNILPGASFQRHYVLEPAEQTANEIMALRQLIRINHEPQLSPDDLPCSTPLPFREQLRDAVRGSDYILINDTHKGTLTRHGTSAHSNISVPTQTLHILTAELSETRRLVDVLDVRRSLDPYLSTPVRVLAASANEVATAVGQAETLPSELDRARFRIGSDCARMLLKRFPLISNWALTCGAAGVQVGIRQHGTFRVSSLPAAIDPSQTGDFTPHCGDMFDAGVIVGLDVFENDIPRAIDCGRMFGAIQASLCPPARATRTDLLDLRWERLISPQADRPEESFGVSHAESKLRSN